MKAEKHILKQSLYDCLKHAHGLRVVNKGDTKDHSMENHATFDAIRANEPVLVLRLELRLRDTGFGSLG